MANKVSKTVGVRSSGIGTKMAASTAAIAAATTKIVVKKYDDEEEDLKIVVARLKGELDSERKTNRQLRREKEAEILRVRNEEQTRASIALKDLSRKLLDERQREMELQREALRSKLEADQVKVVKLKDREIVKLRGDLARSQDQLREELSNRGLSTSARATFDTERQRALQEVRDLQQAKRQLEDRLAETLEVEKQLQVEVRRLQDTCKLEVSRTEREANVEVKKLLEELKAKDHMLEIMNRSIYPDRSTLLKSRLDKMSIEEILNIRREMERSGNSAARSRSCDSSAISSNSCSDNLKTSGCESNCSSRCSSAGSSSKSYSVASYSISTDGCLSNCSSRCSSASSSCSKDNGSCVESQDDSIISDSRSSCADVENTSSIDSNKSCSSSSPNPGSCSASSPTGGNSCSRRLDGRKTSDSSRSSSRPADFCKATDANRCSSIRASHDSNRSCPSPILSKVNNAAAAAKLDQCVISGGCALRTINLQKKLYETEKRVKLAECLHKAALDKNNTLNASNRQLETKVKSLDQQIHQIRNEHESNLSEIKRLNETIVSMKPVKITTGDTDVMSELEGYQQRCAELEQVVASLRRDCQEKDRRIGLLVKSQLKPRHKYEPKTVRFALPNDSDEEASDAKEETASVTVSSCSDMEEQSGELLIQKVHKDYEALMEEHLRLEKYCATLLQNQPGVNLDFNIKRESLEITIQTLEDKLKMADERERSMKRQLQEVQDQNEEMEFRILELEDCPGKNIPTSYNGSEEELAMRTSHLEQEMDKLRQRLSRYESLDLIELEKDASSPCVSGVTNIGEASIGHHQQLSVENLRKLTASLSDSDEDNQMVQSFSTMTSGFDEISCISLELDDRTEMPDMPGEEEADLEKDADGIDPAMPNEVFDEGSVENTELMHDPSAKELAPSNHAPIQLSNLLKDLENNEVNIEFPSALVHIDLLQVESQMNSIVLTGPELTPESSVNEENIPDFQDKMDCIDISGENADSRTLSFLVTSIPQENSSVQSAINSNSTSVTCIDIKQESCRSLVDGEAASLVSKVQRLKDLEDQVSILQQVDAKYSDTIETLNEIERQLIAVIPVTCDAIEAHTIPECSVDADLEPKCNSDNSFWMSANDEIARSIAAVNSELNVMQGGVNQDSISAEIAKTESASDMEHCASALDTAAKQLLSHSAACEQLNRRIEAFERHQSSDHDDSCLEELREAFDASSPTSLCQAAPLPDSEDPGLFGSLKRLAFDVVAAGFRTDLLELKSLTHDFFSATVEDELVDIAYIDEDEAACEPVDADSEVGIERASRLQQRTELRLNTKMSCLNQRFDFLSPTSFDNPDWSDMTHQETVNHCLLQQIEELEKERDSLRDLVYRDDALISDMTQQILRAENSEQELRRAVNRLESADQQASQHIERLEAQCQELRGKLSRAESVEASLRQELEITGRAEAEMEGKLLRSVESLEQTTAKLRNNLVDAEKEKEDMEKHSEEMHILIGALQTKEALMLQRMKSLENLHEGLIEKSNDLETSLTLAYDELAGLSRQKDGLTQRLNSLVDQNLELGKEYDELLVEKKRLVAEVERLSESENFLKEANRKMWLSLQANIEERETAGQKSFKRCTPELANSDIENRKTEIKALQRSLSDSCSQTDSIKPSIYKHRFSQSSTSYDLTQFVARLTGRRPEILSIALHAVAGLLSRAPRQYPGIIRSDSRSLHTEKKARFEEMLKFVTSAKFRSSQRGQPSTITPEIKEEKDENEAVKDADVDVSASETAEGENEFWSVVENCDDIYDVRAADTWSLWRHLERDIMGLNLEELRRMLEEREELEAMSCPTVVPLHPPTPTSTSDQFTQCEIKSDVREEKENRERDGLKDHLRGLMPPPLPSTLPPKEELLKDQPVADVVSYLEQGTQTDVSKSTNSQPVAVEDILALRHQLSQNERTLVAQKNEVDRLTVEMRSWQERAQQAADEISHLTKELSSSQLHKQSTSDRPLSDYNQTLSSGISEHPSEYVARTDRRSRIELPSSQIPVSVKRAVDFYSNISLRSGSTSPGPSSPRASSLAMPKKREGPQGAKAVDGNGTYEKTARKAQGPVNNGGSFSFDKKQQQQQQSPSHIPRLLPDWIQQQQLQRQQSENDHSYVAVQDHGQDVADSSINLQQLLESGSASAESETAVANSAAAAAAAASSSPATEQLETAVPMLPSHDRDAQEEGRDV